MRAGAGYRASDALPLRLCRARAVRYDAVGVVGHSVYFAIFAERGGAYLLKVT